MLDVLSLELRGVETMSRAPTLEVLDTATADLEATESLLRFAKYVRIFMLEQVQDQGPQLRKVEATRVAAKVAQAAAEPNAQLHTSF